MLNEIWIKSRGKSANLSSLSTISEIIPDQNNFSNLRYHKDAPSVICCIMTSVIYSILNNCFYSVYTFSSIPCLPSDV